MRDDGDYFNCTGDQRAAFELGIKLGALFHQFNGAPLDAGNAEALERAMEESLKVQPFVKGASVKISREGLRTDRSDTYGYDTLRGDNWTAELELECDDYKANGAVEFVESLGYPLMYVKGISKR